MTPPIHPRPPRHLAIKGVAVLGLRAPFLRRTGTQADLLSALGQIRPAWRGSWMQRTLVHPDFKSAVTIFR